MRQAWPIPPRNPDALAHLRPILLLVAGTALALAGYFAIVFSCPYGLVATMMTAYVKIPGVLAVIAYKRILSVTVVLILYAIYLWARGRGSQQTNKGLLIAIVGIGIAAIGFLSVNYPCPYPISLSMLLNFDVEFAGLTMPFWVMVVIAACVLLYAVSIWARNRPVASS
jgi:hypothetical protein